MNDRFRSLEELQNRLRITVLAVIRRLKPPATKGLQAITMHATPGALECEGFRTLRTALGMTHQDARQILISSAESGDGKTTTLANLAVCYAQSDKRVLLIDADLRRMGLTQLLNMQGVTGLSEVLRRDDDIESLAAVAHSSVGREGAGRFARRAAIVESLGIARESQVFAVVVLGGSDLRLRFHR